MTSRPTIAVIGIGRWGTTLVRSAIKHPLIGAVGVYDHATDRVASLKAQLPMIRTYGSLNEVWADDEVMGVLVATPMPSHGRLARVALRAGKHVWLEKPMTTSVEEARTLVTAAEQHHRVLLVGHTPQYAPAAQEIHRQIRAGSIGRPHRMESIRLNTGRRPAQGAVLWDLAVHDVALALWWFDLEDCLVRCASAPRRIDEPRITVSLQLGSYGIDIDAGLAEERQRRIEIVGADGRLVWRPDESARQLTTVLHCQANERHVDLPDVDPLHQQLADFVSCMQNGTRPISDGRRGVRVVSVMAQVAALLQA